MAEETSAGGWPVEDIPDADHLYMRVHRTWFKPSGDISLRAFANHGAGMSTDWSKYSTPEQTRDRGRTPPSNAVVRMNVGDIRAMPGQSVAHSPQDGNRAHADVLGEKDEEARMLLRRRATIVLPLPDAAGGRL